ncbi:scaffolding protein [Vibrio phage vB_VpaP_G1]|uniref:Scaffolding protein n=1 Tax=Vibrio phage vB_VpaP_G1 TaxID=2862773 RepID=A0AAE8BLI3_9CAUD|nr:head scaffolding protein [Vibrio phage vB_VpaP_G1]QYW05829.1 scaffolding protein [Vibrio phage vB_VpaP_G1]
MLIRNMFNKYYMDVATDGTEGGAGGGAPATPEATPEANPEQTQPEGKQEPARLDTPEVEQPKEAAPMDEYINQYSETEPALAVALTFLRDAGISPEDPAFALAETENDFSLLEAMLAQKGLPGTEHMLGILKGAVAKHVEAVEAYEKQTQEQILDVLGDTKDAVFAWASENADDSEKEVINDMLDAGGLYARAAAMLLQSAYAGAGDVTKPATNPVKSTQVQSGAAPLSAQDYSIAVDALAKKLGGDPRGSREYQELTARRTMSRNQGY